jgi:hypothetical protein
MNRRTRRYQAATPHPLYQRGVERKAPWEPRSFAEDNAFHLNASIYSALSGYFATRIKLPRLLKMFFGQVSHSQILKARREYPMIERILRSELVRLLFVDTRLVDVA